MTGALNQTTAVLADNYGELHVEYIAQWALNEIQKMEAGEADPMEVARLKLILARLVVAARGRT